MFKITGWISRTLLFTVSPTDSETFSDASGIRAFMPCSIRGCTSVNVSRTLRKSSTPFLPVSMASVIDVN